MYVRGVWKYLYTWVSLCFVILHRFLKTLQRFVGVVHFVLCINPRMLDSSVLCITAVLNVLTSKLFLSQISSIQRCVFHSMIHLIKLDRKNKIIHNNNIYYIIYWTLPPVVRYISYWQILAHTCTVLNSLSCVRILFCFPLVGCVLSYCCVCFLSW